MKKILCVACLIFSSSLWSQENLSVEEYKKFLKINHKDLYNYQIGSVFLNIDYISDQFSENLDPTSLCHTNLYTKETIIAGSFDEAKYYALVETWAESLPIDGVSDRKECVLNSDKLGTVEKKIVQFDMVFPPLYAYFQNFEPTSVVRILNNNILEAIDLEEKIKIVFDFSRPFKFLEKESYSDDKKTEETKLLPSINVEELIPTLKGIPVFLLYLNQMGISREIKVSEDFFKFYKDDPWDK